MMLFTIMAAFGAGFAACAGLILIRHDWQEMPKLTEIIRITPRDKGAAEEREPLFYIEDEEFDMLVAPRPSLLLRYMDMTKERGLDAAIAMAVSEVLGPRSWRALMNSDVSEDQIGQVFEIVLKKVTGIAERPDGPKAPSNGSPNGQHRSAGSRKQSAKS